MINKSLLKCKFLLFFRLLQHVIKGDNFVCVSHDLYESYVSTCGTMTNENAATKSVSEASFKRSIHEIFNVSPTKTHRNNKVVIIYKGLKYVENLCHQPDRINLDLLLTELPPPWFWIDKSHKHRVVGCKTAIFVANTEIIKEVRVTDDGDISIHVGKDQIDPICLGLPHNIHECVISLQEYLQLVEKSKVCMGQETSNMVKGCSRVQQNGMKTFRRVSSGCPRLMAIYSKATVCHRCYCQRQSTSTPIDTEVTIDIASAIEPTPPSLDIPEIEHTTINDDEAFQQLFPNISSDLHDLLLTQSKCSRGDAEGKDARCRRWPKSVISLALSVWIASPAAYRILRETMYLPCEKLLQMYKNSIDKSPGMNFSMCQWLHQECERTGTEKQGGILFDEMTVQPGVQLDRSGDGLKLFGYVDFGENNNGIDIASKGEPFRLATTVLQFVFLAFNGLRFPFAYMLNNGLITGQLTTIFGTLSICCSRLISK